MLEEIGSPDKVHEAIAKAKVPPNRPLYCTPRSGCLLCVPQCTGQSSAFCLLTFGVQSQFAEAVIHISQHGVTVPYHRAHLQLPQCPCCVCQAACSQLHSKPSSKWLLVPVTRAFAHLGCSGPSSGLWVQVSHPCYRKPSTVVHAHVQGPGIGFRACLSLNPMVWAGQIQRLPAHGLRAPRVQDA